MTSFYDQFTEKELEVLRARAERARRGDVIEQDVAGTLDALRVRIGEERYAFPLDALTAAYLEHVNLDSAVAPTPCTPPYIAGVTNIRGRVLPVIDLAVLLGLPAVEAASASLVIAGNAQTMAAFKVAAIEDAMTVRLADLTPIPETMTLHKSNYIRGALLDGAVLLDVAAILNDPDLVVDETVG